MLPEAAHSGLGVHFYVTFWQLSLADINVPIERYQQEVKRLNALIRETSLEEQKKRLQDNVNQLNTEMKDQMKSHEVTRKRLDGRERPLVQRQGGSRRNSGALDPILLVPARILSPTDAILAGKFIRNCTQPRHPQLFRVSPPTTRSLSTTLQPSSFLPRRMKPATTRGSSTLSLPISAHGTDRPRRSTRRRWVRSCLAFQMRWHTDRHGGEEIPAADLLSWEQFRTIFCKWQDCLQKAFKSCFSSKEYMRIRNAIIVMTRISPFYPLIESNGTEISAIVESLAANEQRGDLKDSRTGAVGYLEGSKEVLDSDASARAVPKSSGCGEQGCW